MTPALTKTTAALVLALSCHLCAANPAPPPTPLQLWPGTAPGDTGNLGEEKDTTKPTDHQVAGRPVVRIGQVSHPSLTIYPPKPGTDTGTAVIVCPGGGYYILAHDLEGTEVCEWLNSIGATAVLLKYRVPRREGLEKHTAPLQDAQRALGLVRSRANELGLNPNRIGILGFSAGAHLAATLSNNYRTRSYPPVDQADQSSCRPDFAVLIYPGYLTTDADRTRVAPELALTTNTPPTFLSMSQDDPVHVENALHYAVALQNKGVPFELHVYPTGEHGYGLRRTENPVTHWPDRVADWMRAQGWLTPR